MKVNISFDDELIARIDNYSDRNYMTRSGFISFACTQLLAAEEVKYAIKDLSIAMRKIADTGKIDDESKQQLEDFERIVKVITGSN